MSEKSLWSWTRTGIKSVVPSHEARLTRIENAAGQGTPDLTGTIRGKHFWIEFKFLDEFPKRKKTQVKCDHFTQDQRTFLHDECMCGGRAFVWIQVGGEYFLFDGLEAAMHLGYGSAAWTKEDFKPKSIFYHKKGMTMDWNAFVEVITR